MNCPTALIASLSIAILSSCGSGTLAPTELSPAEQSLLTSLNGYRASEGKKPLQPSANLTAIARADAARRVSKEGGGYVDNRQKTGYERMLTLAGTARAGDEFGSKLMTVWQNHPIQKEWLKGNYSGVGVGTATAESGLQTGVLLLGGFSPEGI